MEILPLFLRPPPPPTPWHSRRGGRTRRGETRNLLLITRSVVDSFCVELFVEVILAAVAAASSSTDAALAGVFSPMARRRSSAPTALLFSWYGDGDVPGSGRPSGGCGGGRQVSTRSCSGGGHGAAEAFRSEKPLLGRG